SGRVKTYVFDALIVIIIAYALSRISERRWTPLLALGWFVATLAASTFSIFALVACAVAGVVIVLHPCGDLRVRVAAISAQVVVAASIARQFPFGAGPTVPGSRTALWFLPVTAFGLAEAAAIALRRVRLKGLARGIVTAVSYGGVAVLFASALAGSPAYAISG